MSARDAKAGAPRACPAERGEAGVVFSLAFGGVVAVAVVLGLVAVLMLRPAAAPDVAAPTGPPASSGGTAAASGVPRGGAADGTGLNPYPTVSLVSGAPTVDVYEDFQCPVCKKLDTSNGRQMLAQARSGKIKLLWHPMTFLEDGLANAPSSTIAANGLYCAADAGKAGDYNRTALAGQPAHEGDGFSTADIKKFGRSAGITGAALTAFDTCVESSTYKKYVATTNRRARDDRVSGTPTVVVDGETIGSDSPEYRKLLSTPNSFASVIVAVTAKGSRRS